MSCHAAGLLGKFISLVFGKKGYQEAFPFPSGTGSGSFRNIKITETSKSIAWKQVVCFTCTPFQVNWITCLCRRTYLQKWYKVINFNHMSGTVLQCIYPKFSVNTLAQYAREKNIFWLANFMWESIFPIDILERTIWAFIFKSTMGGVAKIIRDSRINREFRVLYNLWNFFLLL